MGAPRFKIPDVPFGQILWTTKMSQIISTLRLWFDGQPTQIRRVYQHSAANGGPGQTFLNLADLNPGSFEGHQVYVVDADGTNFGSAISKFAYSDGADWLWLGNALEVESID